MVKCPVCDSGDLKKGIIKETMFGIFLGDFPAEICSSCGESFTDKGTTKKIELVARNKGLWGLGAKTNAEQLAGKSRLTEKDVAQFSARIKSSATKRFLL